MCLLSLLPASAGFLFGFLFYSEDTGDMFLQTTQCDNPEDILFTSEWNGISVTSDETARLARANYVTYLIHPPYDLFSFNF
jgi:hypothetical protein